MNLEILKKQIILSNKVLKSLDYEYFIYFVYDYALENFLEYLERYGNSLKENLFLGINPGYYGMTQTGIPFGGVNFVKNFLKINNNIGIPEKQHEKRKILGYNMKREEISANRIWGFFEKYYITAEKLFEKSFIHSFCSLSILDSSGKNLTPNKLKTETRIIVERESLKILNALISIIRPKNFICIGRYVEKIIRRQGIKNVYYLPHPSPLNPFSKEFWDDFETVKGYLSEFL